MKKHAQELLLSLWKRRGFLLEARSSGEYRYLYGPLGAELKRNLINEWWNAVVTTSGNVQGIDTSIATPPSTHRTEGRNHGLPGTDVQQASILEDCNKTLTSSRVWEEAKPRNVFRHCILQGMLQHGASVASSTGMNLPFGIAEVGRVFKNVPPILRLFSESGAGVMEEGAEHDQAGVIFISKEGREWYAQWQKNRLRWWKKLAHNPGALVLKETSKQDMPQGSVQHSTIQYDSPWGPLLLETIVNHGEHNTESFFICDDSKTRQVENKQVEVGKEAGSGSPQLLSCVTEVDRGILAFLCDSYTEAKRPYGPEANLVDSKVTRLHRRLAPYKVAILPAQESHKLYLYCQMLANELRQSGISTTYDDASDTLEHRLITQDEAGTPYRVIADESSLETGIVSLEDRDTTANEDMNGQDVLLTLQRIMFGVHVT